MVKPVSLSNHAYEVLSKLKTKDESFSDVVLRLAEKDKKKFDIDKMFGMLKDQPEWDNIQKQLNKDRDNFKTKTVNFDDILPRH